VDLREMKNYLFTEQVHEQQRGNLGHALAVANLQTPTLNNSIEKKN
jgi:hypothetical protein